MHRWLSGCLLLGASEDVDSHLLPPLAVRASGVANGPVSAAKAP